MVPDPSRRKLLSGLAVGSAAVLLGTVVPAGSAAAVESSAPQPALIPVPQKVHWGKGAGFALSAKTRIVSKQELKPVADYLTQLLEPALGKSLEVAVPGRPVPKARFVPSKRCVSYCLGS
ncbi:beta-N-acetylhexosaminidase [Renibacterium salmoninarum ATCC 33209]|uniref:Beta-N-acetylhexosaminidase n=1 Tax=Renibacterium salmoninarum (strain ATCC 33209 / DSM 20767 / JCM 11484 / NBRC 15589 / NCIMB 2235) TaxID=288705 RepID=A9WV94_RENSM|nr:glycoside hydrolase family 20 zincin-like fold domain-containing protein [Renibacterium salmoninarum]ABY25115.1 beta-N-acetylhexosaminidase [Renibacterium salmoninarum ATCC 33209]